MGSPPLAALSVRPVEQPDILGNYAKAAQVKQLLQAGQQQAAMAPGQLQMQGEQLKELQLANKKAQDQEVQAQVMSAAYKNALTPDPATGTLKFDHQKVLQSVAANNQGSMIPGIQKSFDELDKLAGEVQATKDKHNAAELDYLGAGAKKIQESNYDPAVAGTVFAHAAGNGYHQAEQILQQISQNPASLKQIVDQTAAASEQQRKLKAEETTAAARDITANKPQQPTEAGLAMQVAGGDPEKALKRLDQSKREARPVNIYGGSGSGSDVKDIADGIQNGDQPPTLIGLRNLTGPVRAELERRHIPIARMETDWKATQKYMSSLNGPQQVRLRQSISSAGDLLDKVDELYAEWKSLAPVSGFKIANHAALVTMKNIPGRAGAVANALDTQIAELTADLGNIYMGGNSPTDQALKLGAKALSSDWGPEAFEEGIKQAHLNVKIRSNSVNHGGPAGTSGDNSYLPPAPAEAPAAAPAQQAPAAKGKTLPMAAIQKAAKDHGVSVDEAKRQAVAAGYTIQ